MHNLRSWYSADITEFLNTSVDEVLGTIVSNSSTSDITKQQQNAWHEEIIILKKQLNGFTSGRIIFEYTIPRMGKRVDTVIIYGDKIFLLEFKCGEREYTSSAKDQVMDYALDLQNFHAGSVDKIIVPIVVATHAQEQYCTLCKTDNLYDAICCNALNIRRILLSLTEQGAGSIDANEWENAAYSPSPTIVEAARALYMGHNVQEISRSDASAQNLTVTTDALNNIIKYSQRNHRKAICFVTGVPGAGKTLVGLNLAIEHSYSGVGEDKAVFLSGNQPLVTVLQEALARDKVQQASDLNQKLKIEDARRQTAAFIQIIHKYRDDCLDESKAPPEKVVIFDEAQRAWTKEAIAKFMSTKKGIPDFNYSEPEFLISTINRHQDWGVVICLVGGGQEINSGEAGLPEWFDSLKRRFADWDVYVTPRLNDEEYLWGRNWNEMLAGLNVHLNEGLHLSTSIRSFRTPDLANFVKALLDLNVNEAKDYYQKIKDKYPILLTRDLTEAKHWVKAHCRGTMRYGLLASSGALRLKPEGIVVADKIKVANWFLNGKDDVRSSYYLEYVASEFDIQGLEVDYSILGWDADLRIKNNKWEYKNFLGTTWKNVNDSEKRRYLLNVYRVLLTRARQGMAIFVPKGDNDDNTRLCEFYNGVYEYLRGIIGD